MAKSSFSQWKNTYEDESARQNSFIYLNWPKGAPVWPILLAQAGFYYQGKDLDVTCFSCGISTSVSDWIRNVHPQQMHYKLNPDCEFIKYRLKPEGGPKTFNDRERWQIPSAKDVEESLQEDTCNIAVSRDEGICTSISNKDSDFLDSERKRNNAQVTMSDNTFMPIDQTIQDTMVSQDSGFPVSESSIVCDSGPIAKDSLLVSGSSSVQPFLYQSGLSASKFSPADSSLVLSTGLESSSPIPENVTYKHPEMETVSARMESFDTWPHKEILSPRILVTAGFFYTLIHDIVRCFCCDLGLSEWDAHDDVWVEHARHSPSCWYLKRVKGERYIDEVQMEWRRVYSPKFSNLISEADRIKTFHNWPNYITTPRGVDIAKAGFFFTGRGDECRCHYCDGGLQHWENGDDPWEQHAYYFPFCKFVIKMKGRQYIDEVRVRFDTRGPEVHVDALIRESEELEAALTRDDVRERKIKEVLSKPEFKDISNCGYSKKAIKMAAEELFKQKGNFNFTPDQILNMILDVQDRGEEIPVDDEDVEETVPEKPLLSADEFMKTLTEDNSVKDADKVLEENRKLKESMICWKCRKNNICILFTPCGHRLTCDDCSKLIHYCLKCNKRVKKKIKTFLS